MKFGTLSVVVGNEACNATCPFCVAQMTPAITNFSDITTRNLDNACRLAQMSGVTTALFTGKGEPTLFPRHIDDYLDVVKEYFPIIELQTNALLFASDHKVPYGFRSPMAEESWPRRLKHWNEERGLTTVAISVVHHKDNENREVYCCRDGKWTGEYPPLTETIKIIHDAGLSVRLSVIGIKQCINTPQDLDEMIQFARENGVEQLTWRPVAVPSWSRSDVVAKAARRLALDEDEIAMIHTHTQDAGTKLLELAHGAEVYDVGGQNVCLTNCLTRTTKPDEIRQLIWCEGAITYDWQYPGARIL